MIGMKHNQNGFGAIEIVIALVVIGLATGTGWYLLQRSGDDKPVAASTTQTDKTKRFTDSAKLYSLQYPDTWSAKEDADCCEEQKDYTQVSRGVTVAPPNKADTHGYGVRVQADKTGSLAKNIEQNWVDNNHQPETKTINGHAAKYVKVTFNGDAENYIDHNYLFTEGDVSVFVTFREKYYHQWPAEDWSAGSDLKTFNEILNSVEFLH